MPRPIDLSKLSCLFFSVLLILTSLRVCSASQDEPFIQNGGYMVVSASGETLGDYNASENFIPASIFKIITALQTLDTLGPSYRFPTYFFITPGIDLYIVGTGDPLLISEDIDGIVTALKKRGINQVRHIFIDNSKYDIDHATINSTISQNPYDTALSALGINFNTIQIEVTESMEIRSGEPQTPTIDIMQEKGAGLEVGVHRINLGSQIEDLALYAGQLFVAGFKRSGVDVTGEIHSKKTPPTAGLFYTYHSPPLGEMIPLMLLYSNNYMANQMYLMNGVKLFGYPATWQKAERAMHHYFKVKHLLPPQQIMDGAGLSKENRVNCQTMIGVLQQFRKYREFLPLKQDIPLKSGTMSEVYSYAGYLGSENDAPAFVLMLNQKKNKRDALLLQLNKLYGNRVQGKIE